MRLLAATVAVGLVLLVFGYALHQYRQTQLADYFAQRAEALAKDEAWEKASFYQYRYLQARPDDFAARVRLVDFSSELAQSGGGGGQNLIRLLYETIGFPVDNAGDVKDRLRCMLAEQLFATGEFAAAADEAQQVVDGDSAEHKAAALRLLALSQYAAVPRRGSISNVEREDRLRPVLPILLEAMPLNPSDVAIARTAATIYREHPLLAGDANRDSSELADDIMDRLVEASPDDANAFIARYWYRKQYLLDGAKADLSAALKLDPNHFEANLLAGIEAYSAVDKGALQAAERFFEKAIKTRPGDERGYLALAQLQWRQGSSEAALELLEEASEKLPSSALAVPFLYADYVLASDSNEDASKIVASLKQQLELQLPRLGGDARAQLTSRMRLLEARLQILEGDATEALSLLSAVASASEQNEDRNGSAATASQATRALAQLLAAAGHWDQAARHLGQLADRLTPEIDDQATIVESAQASSGDQTALVANYRQARIQSAEAYLRSGQPEEAHKQLESLAKFGPLSGEALEARLVVELAIQAKALPDQRSWEEFTFLLQRAKKERPENERVFLAELHYALANTEPSESASNKLADLLQKGEKRFGTSTAFWRAAVQAYHKVGRQNEAERAIDALLAAETSLENRAEAKVGWLVLTGRTEEARDWLSEAMTTVSGPDEVPLRLIEVRLLLNMGLKEEASDAAERLAQSSPTNEEVLSLAWEAAIEQGGWNRAEKHEKRLATAGLVLPIDLHYLRSVRLLNQFKHLSDAERRDLDKSVATLISERPTWQRGAVVAAQYAEACGDHIGAIEGYERAVELGDRQPQTLERLTFHLYRTGQYDRAQGALDHLLARDNDISLDAESLAISTAVKRDQLAKAIDLAHAVVEKHPDDAARRLWLYNVLMVDGRLAEAEQVLTQARQDFSNDASIWNAQFTHFLRTKRGEEARDLLRNPPKSISEDEFARRLALARGYQAIGDLAQAQEHFAAAVQLRPEASAVRLQYATLLLRTNTQLAREQLESLLGVDPGNLEARRKLAALLAVSGQDSDWNRIEELLADSGETTGIIDKRLRAVLLTRRGRSVQERAANCELARKLLMEIVEGSDSAPEDIDRLLLAGAYEQEGMLKKEASFFESARSQLRPLMERPDSEERYQILYLNFLIRSIDALERIPESDWVRNEFLADARQKLEERVGTLPGPEEEAYFLERQRLLGVEVRLLRAEGRSDEAINRLATITDSEIDSIPDEGLQARLVLGQAALYSQLGAEDQAETWYRKLMTMAPAARALLSQSLLRQGKSVDAVNLFLDEAEHDLSPKDAAALAGVLAGGDVPDDVFVRSWPAVAGALEQHNDDPELLMAVAVVQVSRGNQQEAIRLFRRVLAVAPNHAMALNNLATLLGERPKDRAEALELIARAIEISGRNAALLDTFGTIQLLVGDATAAVASLEESVASVDVDPRYYFHLAAAYLRTGRMQDAGRAFDEAQRRGIDKAMLTASDRELMRELQTGLTNRPTSAAPSL